MVKKKKKNDLQIRRSILEKLTSQLYKNKQNRNCSLNGQGIHSKDLILKNVFERLVIKGLKTAGIQSHGLCFICDKDIFGGLAHWEENLIDLEAETGCPGPVWHSLALGLG